MPAHGYNRKDLTTSTNSGGNSASSSSRAQDKAPNPSPVTPAVTGIDYPSIIEHASEARRNQHSTYMSSNHSSTHYAPQHNNKLYNLPNIVGSAIDEPVDPPISSLSLDDVWKAIRRDKERKMAKEKPKVQSLEDLPQDRPVSGSNGARPGPIVVTQDVERSIRIPVLESQPSAPRSIKKQKSMSSFRESSDGRSIVATFEMPPEVEKQDVHISYQRNRLIVTWETGELLEYEEDGVIYRERNIYFNHRTLPLPEGTKFEEVQAVMNDHRLVLRYPNMRCLRVEPRSRSGDD